MRAEVFLSPPAHTWPTPWAGWSWLGQVVVTDQHHTLRGITGAFDDVQMRRESKPEPLGSVTAVYIPPPITLEVEPIDMPDATTPDEWGTTWHITGATREPGFIVTGHGRLIGDRQEWFEYYPTTRHTLRLAYYQGIIQTTYDHVQLKQEASA